MKIQFSDFTFDREKRELHRAGEPLALSPKAFQLLEILLGEQSKAFSKDELLALLWPKTFVSEVNLPSLVNEVRRVLDDDAREPRFIRTVHGFGYSFCGKSILRRGAGNVDPRDPRVHRLIWKRREINLNVGENLLGRDPSTVLWLDHPSVSRRHALITLAKGEAVLQDLASKNGSWVGEERVDTNRRLTNGDWIRIGLVDMTYKVFTSLDSTETLPYLPEA